MHRFGVICGWLGFVLTVGGLVATGLALPHGSDDTIELMMSIVPLGFIFLLFGVTATQMSKK